LQAGKNEKKKPNIPLRILEKHLLLIPRNFPSINFERLLGGCM
jgi:hypothetical protein